MELNAITMHERALNFRAQRNEVLASNIANADTPNYKARDLDFSAALKNDRSDTMSLKTTSALHRQAWSETQQSGDLKYRTPTQPSLDGNTVESDVEQAAFAENAIQYRASLAFVDGYFRSMRFAIKGGD